MQLEINRIFSKEKFKNAKTAVVGISGGGDSLSLLLLLHRYWINNPSAPQIVAVTIDHQLRSESYTEALWVSELCSKLNIKHHIVKWENKGITKNLSAKARYNRYKLLVKAAKQYPKPIILVGHNLNDRIETYLMRAKRQSTYGLAAIAKYNLLFDNIYLWRPLLDISRKELRNYLQLNNYSWIDDPTNENIKYERIAVRKQIGQLTSKEEIEWREKLQYIAKKREEFSKNIANLLYKLSPTLNGECLCLTVWKDINSHDFAYAIGILSSVIGGKEYLPSNCQLNEIKTIINTQYTKQHKFSVNSTILEKQLHNYKYCLWRENRNISAIMVQPHETIIWDNRFKITNNDSVAYEIRTPSTKELKKIIGDDKIYRHETALTIANKGDSYLYNYQQTTLPIKIIRIISLYKWLVSGFDLPIYKAIKHIFN